MKIIIVGCGKVGSTLAKTLTTEKHNIIAIDKDEEVVNKVTSLIDCMGVVGNGAFQTVLLEAGVDSADALIACTSSDEINILTCLIARKTSNCRTIARIRNVEYAKQINYIMSELDISTTINPDLATANEITRMLRYPSSLSSDSFFKGRLNLLKVVVPEDSKLIGCKLQNISKIAKCNVLICIIERDGEIFVPDGNAEIKSGDKICFVADHPNAIDFFKCIGYPYKQLKSFIIIGGGRITRYLIDSLLSYNYNFKIKVIDIDKKICEELADLYPNISIVCADATDKNMLIKEGLYDVDAFITLTGIDEENIILSFFAKSNEKTKVITKINHLNFVDSLKEIDVGNIVNPERIASTMLVSYLRALGNDKGSNIEALYKLDDDRIEALSFKIKKESKVINIPLKELHIKNNILIAGIYRRGQVIIPNGNDQFMERDSVVIITIGHKINEISEIVR